MKPARVRPIAPVFVLAFAGLWPASLQAGVGRLGGGADVSIWRISAALVICIIVAVLAILLIRQRGGKLDLRTLLGRVEFGSRMIQIVETRRLSQHADVSVVRYNAREYFLLIQAGNAQILCERPLPASGEAGTENPS